MALRIKRRFFNAPMCDEVVLAQQAHELLPELTSPPTACEILALAEKFSPELAARTLYEGLLASGHGDFVRLLDGFSRDSVAISKPKFKLYIIPGMFYKEHPEVGADGGLALQIADRFGFTAETLQIHSTGSVSDNSRILAERLAEEQDIPIWLLSLSKGASDVRHYLQHYPANEAIQGWVSVAGTPRGSPLADRKLASPLRRLTNRLICTLFGIDFAALEEMRPSHAFWQQQQWPSNIEMIHVTPIPMSSHIQGELRVRHRQLLVHGPNDGFVPVLDVLDLPGKIYPIWGSDHFLRTPRLSSLLYQLFNYIAYQSRQPKERTT